MQAVDFVTAPAIGELVAANVGACPYTGNARPSQAWFDGCRANGVPILWMTQETYPTRSQTPAGGAPDCQYAEARARERGFAGPIAVVVSDGNANDRWDASGYGASWASVATMQFFPYGALGVTASFLAGAASSPLSIQGEWVPETWGAGRIATQLVGAQAPLSTAHDLNVVHINPTPTPPPVKRRDVISIIRDSSTAAQYAYDGMVKEYLESGDRIQILIATGQIDANYTTHDLLPQQIASIPDRPTTGTSGPYPTAISGTITGSLT